MNRSVRAESRPLLVRRLREKRDELGFIPGDELNRAADLMGVSPRHARRLVKGPDPRPRRWEPSEKDRLAVFTTRSSVAAAHRERCREDPSTPSYPTFRRGLLRALGRDGL